MKLHLAEILMLALIQGGIVATFNLPKKEDGSNAIISNVLLRNEDNLDDTPEPMIGYVGNGKKKRSIRKRSAGRQVDIPASAVEGMMDTPISALSTDRPEIQKEILDTHNNFRRQASPCASNMLKMVWSAEAAKTAKAWAEKCQVGHSAQSVRTIPDFKCGENIFLFAWKVPWFNVIESWFSERMDFVYGKGNITNQQIGHFTQLLWAASHLIGCAVAECPSSPFRYNFVCHYGPSGNKGGRTHPWKEGKPCGDCPNACDNNLCTNACPVENNFGNCDSYRSGCTSDQKLRDTSCRATCGCTKGEIR